jgi:hypothetical protein
MWTEVTIDWQNAYSMSYKYDTIPIEQNGKIYFEILSSENEFGGNWQKTDILMRYEDGKVYKKGFADDRLLIDFNFEIGDTIYNFYGSPMTITTVDSITLENGDIRKRMGIYCEIGGLPGVPIFYWIEGVGSTTGMANYELTCVTDNRSVLLCLSRGDTLLFDHEEFTTCWHNFVSSEELDENEISYHPNPLTSDLIIDDPNNKIKRVWIADFSGRILLRSMKDRIDTSILYPGAYIICFELVGGKHVSERIIKMGF